MPESFNYSEKKMVLTHLDETGAARMVDVSDKAQTFRVAIAEARVKMKPETLAMIVEGRRGCLCGGENCWDSSSKANVGIDSLVPSLNVVIGKS